MGRGGGGKEGRTGERFAMEIASDSYSNEHNAVTSLKFKSEVRRLRGKKETVKYKYDSICVHCLHSV